MPTDTVQQFLTVFEIALFLTGVWLVFRFLFSASFRARWWRANQLPVWNLTWTEFALYLLVLFAGGFIFQSIVHLWLGEMIGRATDRAGLEVMVYGAGLDGGALLGWSLYPFLRRAWHADYGGTPPVEPPAISVLPWNKVWLYAAGTVAASLPLLAALSFAWTFLLKKIGLPDDPQDSIAIFRDTKSPLVVAGMLIVACVLAPIMEELLFRAGLHRFCRKYLGRGSAVLISGLLFGAIHANWAGFLPLSALGILLAVMYETTGSIRVAIVAHAFFNLNTILAILSGLTQ